MLNDDKYFDTIKESQKSYIINNFSTTKSSNTFKKTYLKLKFFLIKFSIAFNISFL